MVTIYHQIRFNIYNGEQKVMDEIEIIRTHANIL